MYSMCNGCFNMISGQTLTNRQSNEVNESVTYRPGYDALHSN